MNENNPCYRKGAIWKTRTAIKAQEELLLGKEATIFIPKNEMVLLLYYEMVEYDESVILLWKEKSHLLGLIIFQVNQNL